MPDKEQIERGAKELEVLQTLRKTGAVDFERVGDLVKNMPDTVLDPGVVAADYIATGYETVIHVWQIGDAQFGLEDPVKVRDLGGRIQRPRL